MRHNTLKPERALVHPAWWIALAVMALNDHVLKSAGLLPGELTGKLSDFAGMLVAPVLLATVIRARSHRVVAACHVAVGVVFAAIQLSPSSALLWTSIMGLVGYPWTIVCDPSDLMALPMLALSWRWLVPKMSGDAVWWRRGSEVTLAAIGMYFCIATSDTEQADPEPQIECIDQDGDGFCHTEDCDDNDFAIHDTCNCVDFDGDGVCATFDCDDTDFDRWDDCGFDDACNNAPSVTDGSAWHTTVDAPNRIEGMCQADGGEVVLTYDVAGAPDEVQYIKLSLSSLRPHSIEIRELCDTGEAIACEPADQSVALETLSTSGTRLYIVVEAETVEDQTDFELTVESAALVCGDGELVGPGRMRRRQPARRRRLRWHVSHREPAMIGAGPSRVQQLVAWLVVFGGTVALAGCPDDVCVVAAGETFDCIDEDGDGFCAECCDLPDHPASSCALLDCDDDDAYAYPGAKDHFVDGKDYDCDGGDLGGVGSICSDDAHCAGSCNASSGLCAEDAEICTNAEDDDGDGEVDCHDDDCFDACYDLKDKACAEAPWLDDTAIGFDDAGSIFLISCGLLGEGDRVFRVRAPGAPGTLTIEATSGDAFVEVGARCDFDELGCQLVGPGQPLSVPVEGDGELWLLVEDDDDGAAVTLTTRFEPAVCGDGVIEAPESCDDGNADAGDGCDVRCRVEEAFDVCSAPTVVDEGVTTLSTRLGTNLMAGSCGGDNALERLHVFTPSSDGTLNVALQSDSDQLLVYARQDCHDDATADQCLAVDVAGPTLMYLPVSAGVPVFIAVDGRTPDAMVGFDYELTLVLSGG